MKAVILAGGLGTRLSEETGHTPKPMIQIGGRCSLGLRLFVIFMKQKRFRLFLMLFFIYIIVI